MPDFMTIEQLDAEDSATDYSDDSDQEKEERGLQELRNDSNSKSAFECSKDERVNNVDKDELVTGKEHLNALYDVVDIGCGVPIGEQLSRELDFLMSHFKSAASLGEQAEVSKPHLLDAFSKNLSDFGAAQDQVNPVQGREASHQSYEGDTCEPKESQIDPLCDPDQDLLDKEWVSRTFRSDKRLHAKDEDTKALKSTSAAMLSCPGCFTAVCFDSERSNHRINGKDVYHAIVAFNCIPDKVGTKSCSSTIHKKRERRDERLVRCSECSTIIGTVDIDEVYEFRNTLPSAIGS